MNLQENISRIKQVMGIKEVYNPAGKKHKPSEIVFHKSSPKWRDDILQFGLRTLVGDCYMTYVGEEEQCIPAIFATDSEKKENLFDSTYDDDIWEIDTKIADVKWFKDKHFEGDYHIVTFENITPNAIKLVYEGTGRSLW